MKKMYMISIILMVPTLVSFRQLESVEVRTGPSKNLENIIESQVSRPDAKSPDKIKVAVIDTGLSNSKWPEAIKDANMVPHACDGKVFDFVQDKVNPSMDVEFSSDDEGHGTHIAGLISMNAAGVPHCIVPMKYYSRGRLELDNGNLYRSIRAIRKAIELKVDIINYSGGGVLQNEEECSAVKAALDAGIVFVAAAGNEGSDLVGKTYYPALCDKRVVIVGATDSKGKRLQVSNYSSSDDIKVEMERGRDLLSTIPNGQVGYMTGTSQATAIMTGRLVKALWDIRSDKYMSIILNRKSN